MSLGLTQDLAEFIAAEFGLGLYDDPDISKRVIFVQSQPPVPEDVDPPEQGTETTNPLAIALFVDGGSPGTKTFSSVYTYTIQTRHPLYATAITQAGAINDLLSENGGAGINVQRQGKFGANRIAKITADFPPQPLGRDPSPRDGREIVTQSFTVLAMAPTIFS